MTFAIVPAPLFADTRLNRADLRVYGALATFADKDTRTCFPWRKTIGEVCGIKSVALISAALSRLQRYGWIEITHRLGGSLYRLLDPTVHPVVDDVVHPGVDDIEQTTGTTQLPPTPQESQINLDLTPEPTPEPVCEAAPPKTGINASPQPEIPAEADSEAPDDITALIAFFWTISGTKANAARHRKALRKALKTNTPAEIERAAKVAKSTWSNPAWITPAAVCKPGRIDELLSQAKATAAPRAACHVPFKREKPEPRCAPEVARAGIASLKAALAG
jgi:hypothetical protein